MEQTKYPLIDLDDLHYRMTCAIKMLDAVHTAIEEGQNAAEEYADAIFGTYDYMWSLNAEFRECIDALFAERQVAKEAVAV